MADTSLVSTGSRKRPIKRYYGLSRSGKKATLSYFIVREIGNVPEGMISIRETMEPSEVVLRLAIELLETEVKPGIESSEQKLEPVDVPPTSGDIVFFVDGERVHSAILLDVGSTESFALFLTTNPSWNPSCRRIKRDEMAFTGWAMRDSRITYLAPVVRPNHQIVKTERSISEQRLDSLRKEFRREFADGY